MCDEDFNSDNETILLGKEHFLVNTFYVICDTPISEIKDRAKSYAKILEMFDIFLKKDMEEEELKGSINRLLKTYKNDVDEERQFLINGERGKFVSEKHV